MSPGRDSKHKRIQTAIIDFILQNEYDTAIRNICCIFNDLYAGIPDNKRISYGRVHVVKIFSEHLYIQFVENNIPVYRAAANIFERSDDFESKGVALSILSLYGFGEYKDVLDFFKSAASSADWNMREIAAILFRKLIKKHPDEIKEFLLDLSESEDANIRRFVSETLRPVQENRWFYKNPDYPLSILQNMFAESSLYPRTSLGNNLSDLARKLPRLVYAIVKELIETGDKNSYWIAYRACRNLVKTEPVKVMDLLKTDEYKYKKRIYKKSACTGN